MVIVVNSNTVNNWSGTGNSRSCLVPQSLFSKFLFQTERIILAHAWLMSINILLPVSMALQTNYHLLIYDSFNSNLGSWHYTMFNVGMINYELKKIWNTIVVGNCKVLFSNYPDRLRKTIKPSVKSRCPNEDSNWTPLEYKCYNLCQLASFVDQFCCSGMILTKGCQFITHTVLQQNLILPSPQQSFVCN
jgi:hypothetical protein